MAEQVCWQGDGAGGSSAKTSSPSPVSTPGSVYLQKRGGWSSTGISSSCLVVGAYGPSSWVPGVSAVLLLAGASVVVVPVPGCSARVSGEGVSGSAAR
jgi:hypothetical protein